MTLFDQETDKTSNLLPKNGIVNYYDDVFSEKESFLYFKNLLKNIYWQQDVVFMFGKKITTKRKVAWYADKPFEYTYSKNTKVALPFTNQLLHLKKTVEKITKTTYNCCLLNLYHNGNEGMSWHTDNEKELLKNGTIASISFGAKRKFVFKHKKDHQKVEIYLNDNSLLVMKGEIQNHWLHSLPKSTKVSEARINLTFRTIQK